MSADFVKRGLLQSGFEVTVACAGYEGMEMAQSSNPDLVVLDLMLPLRQGFRPLDRILSRVQEIGSENLATRIPEAHGPPELEELANNLNTMLQRLDRAFRAREVFIASVSHDLKTPLTVL